MYKDKYELNVLVNGKPVREYFHNNKFFVEAKSGTEYSLKIKNHSHKRCLVIVSVDGIEVLKGEKGAEAQSGYIVNPFSSINVTGYRIDNDNVATFKFSDGKTSYATQVEQKFDPENLTKVESGEISPSRNNGVIGVKFIEEKDPVEIPTWESKKYSNKYSYYDYHLNYAYSGFSGISGYSGFQNTIASVNISGCSLHSSINNLSFTTGSYSPLRSRAIAQSVGLYAGTYPTSGFTSNNIVPDFTLGTAWGQQIEDKITEVKFVKSDNAFELELFYLERTEMEKIGIDFEKTKKVFISGWPKAFSKDNNYCQKPLNWEGK